MPSRNPAPETALACAGLLVLTIAPFAAAQNAPPVHVRFTFADPQVSALYSGPPERKAAEDALSLKLAKVMEPVLQYWPANGAGPGHPLLQLQLKRDGSGSRWFLAAEMHPVPGLTPAYTRSIEVYAAGDITARGGFPKKVELPARIEMQLKAFYANAVEATALQEKLAGAAPLGNAAHVTATTAILPLDWARYCSLATSTFALEYDLPAGGRVTVLGQGTGEPAQYTPDQPRFRAVTILPQRWQRPGVDDDVAGHRPEIPTLLPRFIRLKTLNPDASMCIDIAGAPPAVIR